MPIPSYLSNIVDLEAKSFFAVDNPAVVLETVKKVRLKLRREKDKPRGDGLILLVTV